MSFLVDATGIKVNTNHPPQRIVSLVPSTTHSICSLERGHQLVGITRFCNRPASIFSSVAKVGGTKNVSIEKIMLLKPDIVLANKEENTKETIEALREHNIPVYVAYPTSFSQALSELDALGTLLHISKRTQALVQNIKALRQKHASFRYAYLIWNEPTMTISSDTFISSMLKEIGGINVFAQSEHRYPTIEKIPLDTDALLLSSEPFPFQQKHKKILSQKFSIPICRIHLIDGAHCSWHGANIQKALPYLHSWRQRL